MKSLHFLALAVVAVLALAIGYYVGSGGQGKTASEMIAMVKDDVKAVTGDISGKTDEKDGKVLATVNGKAITEADVENLYTSLPQQYRQAPIDFLRDQLLEQLISMEVIGQAAVAENLDQDAKFVDRLENVRTQLMQEFYLQNKIDELVTDELVRAEYDKVTADFQPQEEVHARHILLKNAEEANDIIKLLDEGGDFAELAKEYSTGPSGPNGGDLGYFTKERMVPAFATAAFAMEKGAHSKEPVQTEFGFHVIKVEDKRDTQPPAFEEREKELRGKVTNTTVNKLIEDLKSAAVIEITPKPAKEAEDDKEEVKKD